MTAAQLLERIRPGLATMKMADYVAYIEAQFAGLTWSVDDMAVLCRHYGCSVDELAKQIARDRLGKG